MHVVAVDPEQHLPVLALGNRVRVPQLIDQGQVHAQNDGS